MSTVTTNPSEVKFTPYVPAPDEEYMSDAQLEQMSQVPCLTSMIVPLKKKSLR